MKDELGVLKMKEKFRQFGYKFTAQRQVVLDVLLEHPELHMSSEEICIHLRQKKIRIGQSTVYRTLTMLEKMRIVRRVNLEDGLTRYELFDHEEDHAHHHLICTKCGLVTDIKSDLLKDLEQQILQEYHFEVTDHCLRFLGLCENCRNPQ
jgi:Fur family ferric uptake transcriptional regulator